jgi:hypothetical protein
MAPLRTAAAIAATLIAPASAVAAAVEIAPSVASERFEVRVTSDGGSSLLRWGGPDRFAAVPHGARPPLERIVRDGGLETSTFAGGGGSVVRRTFAASPDGFTALDLVDGSIETLLARARAGATTLVSGRVGAHATLRGTVRLSPNDCAGLRGGVKTIDLDARTLLPLRIVTRRAGARAGTVRLTGLRVNPALAPRAFRALRPRGSVFRDDQGFRRVGPLAAARNLPYVPALPAVVPAGFQRVLTGWAPRSAITGPEGSIPARPSLFAAVYARGWERIEITQRRAVGGDWPEDPFGGECRPLTAAAVTVHGVAATYAFGAETGPHLFWREGRVLHTVSGPFPIDDLVAVAESLAPVPGS